MIELENISKTYPAKKQTITAVDDVSLSVKEGEIYGIVGYSGAGKSTLLRCINLLESPTSGSIEVDGTDLLSLKPKELRKSRQSMGMIFQGFHLALGKTVLENIAFALKASRVEKKERRKRALELLELVGLEDKASSYPAELSGGQKQRVSIARALANKPKVLLCDEATSALDPNTTQSILALLKKINQELGLTIVLITHEMEAVKEICDRCAVMEDGRIIERGSTYALFSSPQEELTKRFIRTVIDFRIPERLMEETEGTLVKLTFKKDLAKKSIVSDLLQQYEVSGNILHGKIDYIKERPLGTFIMELTGDPKEVAGAIRYLEGKLGEVEVIQHDRTTRSTVAGAE
ncbi:ATP-binding cassette domain-containing protein [Salimicrobium sp. PL1-032A]|uniref:methionine ABC transporter ATP-binding protein n=1 Tax=Salimicrobium sp. PL1-032A TaxID=3095364 RepID=UPI0032608215